MVPSKKGFLRTLEETALDMVKLRNSQAAQQISCQSGVVVLYLFRAAVPAETAEPILDLLSRTFRSPGSRRERASGKNRVAGKWRRNDLKRLNPRREMVWPRKPRTHKMWYEGARLTVRDSG